MTSDTIPLVYYGAIVLSSRLRKILLVKPSGQSSWCLPIGSVNGYDGVQAAGHVVEHQAGIIVHHLLREEVSFEVEFPPGTKTRTKLYIAHGVRCDRPIVDKYVIEDAAWMDLASFMADIADAIKKPFIEPLSEWLTRNHHLREEKDIKSGRLLVYNKSHWKGPKPMESLAALLVEISAAAAEYKIITVVEFEGKKESIPTINRPLFGCTVALPHLQYEVTPHHCYFNEIDAQEMAALTGILYIKGGLDENSKGVTIRKINTNDTNILFWNERITEHVTRQREGLLQNGGFSHWQDSISKIIPIEQAKIFRPLVKTPSAVLAEFCEKKKVALTTEFEKTSGGYTGRITIPEYKYEAFSGLLQKTRKAAKENVSSLVLESLKSKGLYTT